MKRRRGKNDKAESGKGGQSGGNILRILTQLLPDSYFNIASSARFLPNANQISAFFVTYSFPILTQLLLESLIEVKIGRQTNYPKMTNF